jgi:hypothetical protein
MAEVYTDITTTLDELYAKDAFSNFTPEATETARSLMSADAKKINERGGLYLSLTEIPMNFASDDFAGALAGAEFGDAGRTSWLKQTVTALKRMSSVKWQDEVDTQSKSSLRQAPVKSRDEKMGLIKGHLAAYGVSFSRELWGDKTNEVARVSAINTGSKTVTCANAGNLFGVFNIHVGQQLAVYNGASKRTTGSSYVTVSSVNRSNRTFVYSDTAPTGTASGDILYPAQTTTDSKDKGLAGASYMLAATGAYQGVSDRTTSSQLIGTRFAAAGAVLSAAWLRKMMSEQDYRVIGGAETDGSFYASAQFDAYEATELGKQSWSQTGTTLNKGYRILNFDKASFKKDPYVPRDAVAYVDFSKVDRFALAPYAPVKSQSGTYELQVPAATNATYQDNVMVLFRGYEQLGCEQPTALGVWADGFSTAGLALGYTS